VKPVKALLRLLKTAPFPLSFKQLLGLSFAIIWLLLGGALFRALVAVDTLSRDSRDFPGWALQQSEQVRDLSQTTLMLERQVRQYEVLHDPSLRQDIHGTLTHGLTLVKQLAHAHIDALGPDLDRWEEVAGNSLAGLVDGRGGAPWPSEGQLEVIFGELGRLDRELERALQDHLNARSQSLEREFERQRENLIVMGLTATTWALVLAMGLGAWLSWSFAQLDRAIRRLGEGQQSPLKPIGGPTDIRQLGERVRGVQQRLAHLESVKLQFLRHISHELKTPLANIREGVSLMEEQVPGPINEAQREILSILSQNSLALQQQIEGLLEYNAAASGAHQLNPRWIDVRVLLAEAVEAQRLPIQAKSLQVMVNGPALSVWVDHEKMMTVVSNLLINAVRFSPEGGRVSLDLEDTREEWRLSIQDEGPGVEPSDRARIFEPFFQGKRQPVGARRGSGVGLSIVRELVQAHGGKIILEERPGGACFRLGIPKP
jgi:Osmosensitive K+ channel histidine kinase